MRSARWTRGELKPSEELEGKAKRGGGSDKALHFNIVSFSVLIVYSFVYLLVLIGCERGKKGGSAQY